MTQLKYVWQKSDWPNFNWDSEQLLEDLGQARKLQGKILGYANFIGLETQANLLVGFRLQSYDKLPKNTDLM